MKTVEICHSEFSDKRIPVDLPVLMFVGFGRCAKDTAGAWFGKHTFLRYTGSTSELVNPLIAKELGISEEESWNTRHANRMFWREWCDNYRRDDPGALIRLSAQKGELIIGPRDIKEIIASREEGIADLIIWIENDRVPPDPTVAFSKKDADIVIENHGTFEEYYAKLEALARALNVLKS